MGSQSKSQKSFDSNIDKRSISKLKVDILHLLEMIQSNLKDRQNIWRPSDAEFIRQWQLWGKIRSNLQKLDPELFKDLRDIQVPQPDRSIDLYEEVYYTDHLKPLRQEILRAVDYLAIFEKDTMKIEEDLNTLSILKLLTSKFNSVARQLQRRYNQRTTIGINDEYDVQDLFHALLCIYFNDIRPEERTPSYAGGSSTMDFLLKSEQVVVETKKTRKNLGAKEVGEQLIVDIKKYKEHPKCKTLFCFVYDPEERIVNPVGIENDLTSVHNGLNVLVVIEPKK